MDKLYVTIIYFNHHSHADFTLTTTALSLELNLLWASSLLILVPYWDCSKELLGKSINESSKVVHINPEQSNPFLARSSHGSQSSANILWRSWTLTDSKNQSHEKLHHHNYCLQQD
jgi:hypothetical protein